jgi:DNA repair ATPase RecN
MSFLETFERLDQKLIRHERVIDLEQRRNDYRRVQEELLAREDVFRRLHSQVKLFREGELPLGEIEPLLADLVNEVRSLSSEWKADPVSLLHAESRWERLAELTDLVESLLETTYQQVQAEWQADAMPAFYAPLTRNTPLKALVERIQAIDQDLPRLLPESMPNEASRLKRARTLKAERDRLRKDLEAAIPQEVRDLFARITRGEATLFDVTVPLLEKLREMQADRLVRLSLR